MTKVLRKISIGLILVSLFICMLNIINEVANIVDYIIIIVDSIILAVFIKQKQEYNKFLREYKELFIMFKNLHAQRYYYCFSGSQEEVDETTELIELGADQIINVSTYFTKHICASRRQIKEVEYIVEQTEKLRKTIQPPI